MGPALAGKNLVLAIPTASGKSLIAYLAILKSVLKGGKALYIVPLRALASGWPDAPGQKDYSRGTQTTRMACLSTGCRRPRPPTRLRLALVFSGDWSGSSMAVRRNARRTRSSYLLDGGRTATTSLSPPAASTRSSRTPWRGPESRNAGEPNHAPAGRADSVPVGCARARDRRRGRGRGPGSAGRGFPRRQGKVLRRRRAARARGR